MVVAALARAPPPLPQLPPLPELAELQRSRRDRHGAVDRRGHGRAGGTRLSFRGELCSRGAVLTIVVQKAFVAVVALQRWRALFAWR
eukprot:9500337-Pyramimonas_sp.AAC.1